MAKNSVDTVDLEIVISTESMHKDHSSPNRGHNNRQCTMKKIENWEFLLLARKENSRRVGWRLPMAKC